MVRYKKIIFLISIAILCIGCGKNNDGINDKKDVNNGTSDNISQEETSHENTQAVRDYFKNANIVQDYDPNRTYFSDYSSYVTIDNDLMYSIVSETTFSAKYIYVADFKTGVQMPLCSKIDCNHNNDRCNAYIGGTNDEKIGIDYMCIIDNVIYVFGEKIKTKNYSNVNSDYFLMRISSDGSIREDLGTILSVYGDSKDIIKQGSLIHRGFLYYVVGEKGISGDDNNSESSANKIYRYSIDGSGKPECVYEFSYLKEQGEDPELMVGLEAQGENLYVRQTVVHSFINSENHLFDIENEEYKINIDTLEKEKISTEISYAVQTERNSLLYIKRYNTSGDIALLEVNNQLEYEEYCRQQKMSFYNNTTKEIKELTEKYLEDDEFFDMNDFWVTDKYICFNVRKINGGQVTTCIFDFDWNLVKKLDDTNGIDHCFGEYIMWHESNNDDRIYYMANIEECISGSKRYGVVLSTKKTGSETHNEVDRYIYKE